MAETTKKEAPKSLWLANPAEGSANNFVFREQGRETDIEYIPAASATKLREALKPLAQPQFEADGKGGVRYFVTKAEVAAARAVLAETEKE